MDFLIATHNLKKRDELQRILAPLGVHVLTADEAGIDLSDVEETGTTFMENALLKARSGCKESGMPCIADDSGLCVDALDGAPGVYSARFAGEHGNDAKNNAKLLGLLESVADGKERAALRAQANGLDPLFQVGKGGVSDALIKQTDDALTARELIKLKVLLETAPARPRDIADEIAAATGAEVVSVVGGSMVFYRYSEKLHQKDKPKRK